MDSEYTVFIVGDDASVREALLYMAYTEGLHGVAYSSGKTFLEACDRLPKGCLVLDARMPGVVVPALLEQLNERHIDLPVIIITGEGDAPTSVQAVEGSVASFVRPFDRPTLLKRIREAAEHGLLRRRSRNGSRNIEAKMALLTKRERDVLALLINGYTNKAIAAQLGIGIRTVETHRAKIKEKMQANSLAHLIRMALEARKD